MLRSIIGSILLGLLLLHPTVGLAQNNTTPHKTDESTASPSTTDNRHRQEIEDAKALIKKGSFAEAYLLLTRLGANSEQASQTAQLLYELSEHWSKSGFKLLKADALEQPTVRSNSTSLEEAPGPNSPSESELASLYVDSVLYGFASGGVWFGGVLEVNNTAGVVLPALALAGASSYGVYKLNQNRYLSRGMPRTISLGLRLGFIESTLLTSYAGSQYQHISPKTLLAGAWAGTTLGAVIGGLVAHERPISPARASLIESTAIWTGILSTMGHHSIRGNDTGNEILLTTSAGVLGGAAIGAAFEQNTPLTESRVRYLDLGALAGGLISGGLYASFAPEGAPEFVAHGIIASGIASGWYTAYRLTQKSTFAHQTTNIQHFRLVALPTRNNGLSLGSWGQF